MKKNRFIIYILAMILLFVIAGVIYGRLTGMQEKASRPAESPADTNAGSDGEAKVEGDDEANMEADTKEDTQAQTAPDFTVLDAEGNEVKLSDFIGKPVVINFWATWCPPCKSELPAFQNIYNEYGEKVTFLMVNMTDGGRDTVEGVKQFVQENGYTFPVYYDTEQSAANTYEIYSIPETVFLASDGTLAGSQIGAMSEDTLLQYIEHLLAEE